MRTCVIVNPVLGPAEARGPLQQHLDRLRHATVVHALRPGDVPQLTRAALRRGFDTVVAAGDDQTISGVVEGIGASGAAQLGIIPFGGHTDLAVSLGVPLELEAAVDLLLRGASRPIDLIAARGTSTRYGLNLAVGGFSAALDAQTGSSWQALERAPGFEAQITCDSAETITVRMAKIVIANGRFMGASGQYRSRTLVNDGLLDIYIVPSTPPVFGKQGVREAVISRRVHQVRISAVPQLAYTLDGELLRSPVSYFEALPGILPVIAAMDAPVQAAPLLELAVAA